MECDVARITIRRDVSDGTEALVDPLREHHVLH